MVPAPEVKKQLKQIGADYSFWGAPEIRELPKILFEHERILHLINGRYSGGFATLCATNIRVLLIDKKPLFLTLEDVRYDMVSDVLFNHRLLNASIVIGTVHNSIAFIGFNKAKLRGMTNFIQERVMEFRRHQAMQDNPEPVLIQQVVPTLQPDSSYQPVSLGAVATASAAVSTTPQLPINPYKMPIKIRRRASSRFY